MSQTNPNPAQPTETPHVHAGLPSALDDTPRAGGRAFLGVLITFALLAVGWYHTFYDMWYRWFPSWGNLKLSLGDRLTHGESYYTHGPMVPVVSLLIAFLIYRRVGAPTSRTRRASAVGGVLLGGSLLLHLLSVYARVSFVSGFALIGVLAALLLLWGGWPLLKAYWLPVAFLAFMVPLPMDWIFKLNFQLKFFAGNSALWLTNHVFKVPAVMNGATIIFEPAADGTPKQLVVESVCGGLRSLISLISFAALFALICRARGVWRLVILALSVPVAIICNIVRITALNLVAHYVSVDAAGPESAFHNFTGLLLFIVALALLFGIEQLILLAGRLLHRNWADNRLLGFLDHVSRGHGSPPATLRPAVLLALALTAGLSVFWATKAVAQNGGNFAGKAVPKSIVIDGKPFGSVDEPLDDQTLAILETNDYVYRRFYDLPTRREADLLIVFSPDNRKGTHPPDVCLEGGGEEIIHKANCTVEFAEEEGLGAGESGLGTQNPSPQPLVPRPVLRRIVFRELVSEKDNRQTFHLYVYKCGRDYTNSYWMQQLKILVNGLTSRNAAGALIRFTVPIDEGGLDAARGLAVKAARELLPAIDKGLP